MACRKCDDTGVIETGNNDLPCDYCPAGATAQFNVAGQAGPVSGRELKRQLDGPGFDPIWAETLRSPELLALLDENKKLKAKLTLAKECITSIKKNALWGVEANCDYLLAKLEE